MSDGCTTGCGHCVGADNEASGQGDAPAGWRLVLPAAGAFLLPLAFAITGAAIWRRSPTAQALGALGGLLAGFLIAVLAQRLFRGGPDKPENG